MNWITMCCYNNVDLTRKAVQSALAQDIGDVKMWIVDNGSTDSTWEYLNEIQSPQINISRNRHNQSPVKVCNSQLDIIFHYYDQQYVLGIPNDVVLPPNAYRKMLEWPRGIVTASMTVDENFPVSEDVYAVNECTPLAVSVIRRWCYEAIVAKDGYFYDPEFFLYASDCSLALSLAACGIRGVQLSLQYFHHVSATLKNAPPEESAAMGEQANADRAYFERKHGFKCTDLEYGACAQDINFKGGKYANAAEGKH